MKPVLQALILAERVYEDKTTGKKVIAGTFNGLMIGKVQPQEIERSDGSKGRLIPGGTDVGSPSLYLSLTDVVDGTELSLQVVDVTRNNVLFILPFKITKADRLATIEVIAPLPPLSMFIKQSGVFTFELVWQGEILGLHRLIVKEMEPPTQAQQEESPDAN